MRRITGDGFKRGSTAHCAGQCGEDGSGGRDGVCGGEHGVSNRGDGEHGGRDGVCGGGGGEHGVSDGVCGRGVSDGVNGGAFG